MKTSILIIILAISSLFIGCKRRPLTYPEQVEYAELIIDIDWTKAFSLEDKPTGVSVWLYPQDGGLPLQTYSANVDEHRVLAKVGNYDVVVFNLTPFELSSTIGFRGTESLETLEVYSQPITTTREPNASRGTLVQEPEPFAVGLYRDLVVTKAMVEETKLAKEQGASKVTTTTRRVFVTPLLANHRHAVRVEVKGFKNLASGGVYGELSGLAEGFYVGSGKTNITNARQKLQSWDQTAIDNVEDKGETYVEYTTWGLVGEETKTGNYDYWTGLLELLMRLVNGDDKAFEINLDHENIKENSTSTQTNIELVIEVGFDGRDTPIVLPDVEPTDDPTGFDPEVAPWDEEDVPVVVG